MLAQTFQHLDGIGPKKERALWKSGVESWDDFEATRRVQGSLFGVGEDEIARGLAVSRRALSEGLVEFFADRLPQPEHYRIACSFPEKTMFLDIETTGLSVYYDEITMVGWAFGSDYQFCLAGADDRSLGRALSEARVVVTFNGSLFDLPFLRKHLPHLPLPAVHIDLRFLARRVGFTGGQKTIELAVGLKRGKAIDGLRGDSAPLLWHRYKRGDTEALRSLVEYNRADIKGMQAIFDVALKRLLRNRRFPVRVREIPHFSQRSISCRAVAVSNVDSEVPLMPFTGQAGPALRFAELGLVNTTSGPLRVVGIDPTGSPSRPSGWCVVEDERVLATRRLGSDEEILTATLEARPHLVSIDSPLSLPAGRQNVSDEDPGRDRFGITRECERVLKKRGVNVYPCLIRSMQALTARGIRLTQEFRHRGVPVIESYPGAAQDILGIPRKRASLDFLRTGLGEFGLTGNFLSTEVSHDELDAITSAVVGLLFWSGRFEALGNEAEGHLIIPDLKVDFHPWKQRRVIGLSGPMGSGKTTAGRFLEGKGFRYGRFSMVLAEQLTEKGVAATRTSLQELGEQIYREGNQRWLGNQLLSILPKSNDLVIDGLRHPEDHTLLVETFGPSFTHVHLDIDPEVLLGRNIGPDSSPDEFDTALRHPVEANVSFLSSLAHFRIANNGSLNEFFDQLTTIAEGQDRPSQSLPCL